MRLTSGDDLQKLLSMINLSKAELSRMLDIPYMTLKQWCLGYRIPPPYIYRYIVLGLREFYASPRSTREQRIKEVIDSLDYL